MLSFKDNIGMWKIVLNQITDADFVIGYGFDNNEKLWKVYQNNERGMKAEWTFENEEEALENYIKSKISVQNNKLNKVFKKHLSNKNIVSAAFLTLKVTNNADFLSIRC